MKSSKVEPFQFFLRAAHFGPIARQRKGQFVLTVPFNTGFFAHSTQAELDFVDRSWRSWTKGGH